MKPDDEGPPAKRLLREEVVSEFLGVRLTSRFKITDVGPEGVTFSIEGPEIMVDVEENEVER